MPVYTRRELIRLLGGAATVLSTNPSCKSDSSAAGVFTDDERDSLAALANAVIPPDDAPGGAALGAVDYIERMLTMFDDDPAKVFAGGPFSGRAPFPDANGQASTNFPSNDFQNFIELDRVSEAAWRFQILGSAGLPNGGPNDKITGPVKSMKDTIKAGLAAAMQSATTPLSQLAASDLQDAFNEQPQEFKDLLIELVTEAAFAAPEYGGNLGLAGWKMISFEGDSQPLGYTQFVNGANVERPEAPLSTANPGADPFPITSDVDDLLKFVIAVLGGRSA